jgi:hypothetical protein
MPFQNPPVALGQIEFSDSSTAKHEVGAFANGIGGKRYRYVKVGDTALVAGNLVQAPAELTDHYGQAPAAAAAIGARSVTVTIGGSTAVTADQYRGGQLIVDTTPGEGYAYQIKGHPAAAGGASCVFTLDDPIVVALTTGSRVTLAPNPFSGVIAAPASTLTGAVVGAAVYPITALYYGWIQVGGPAAVLIGGTPAVGYAVSAPTAGVAGAASINSATLPIIGNIMVTGVNTKILPVFLTCG